MILGYVFILLNLGNNRAPDKLLLWDTISQITHGIAGIFHIKLKIVLFPFIQGLSFHLILPKIKYFVGKELA